jgi:hypothetical protein
MQSRRRHHRSRWAHCNTPEALRRRRAAADARREALAALLPPIPADLQPLTVWQRIEVVLYVPTSGRCDQHAVEIDGERVGLLSATQIGVRVREAVRKRPSAEALEDCRRGLWESATAPAL